MSGYMAFHWPVVLIASAAVYLSELPPLMVVMRPDPELVKASGKRSHESSTPVSVSEK
jgi:hypothetical protein